MNKEQLQQIRDALLNSAGHNPDCGLFTLNHNGNYLPCDCGINDAIAILDAALAAEPQQPVAWRDKSALPGYPSYEYNRQGIGEPLYTAPVAAHDDAIDWEGVAADQAMTIAMLKVDYQQLQALVTSQSIRSMEQEEWQKDAARYRWMRDHASNDWLDSGITDDAVDEAINDKSQWRGKP